MASDTEIANLAISHLGIGKNISNLTTERSEEALACKQFYATALDQTLRDFPWPFATKFRDLSLIEEDPTTEWSFSYREPSDCLKIRRILSGTRNDSHQSRVPYRVGQDDDGLVIYTDAEDAQLEYTYRANDPTRFPPDFMMALSFRLAMYIAPRITIGDQFKLKNEMAQFYIAEISRAMASAINEEQPDQEPDAEWMRARNGESDETCSRLIPF